MSAAYDELKEILRDVATLGSVNGLMGWDQETMMPSRAADGRARALALLSRLHHERFTSPRVGELLDLCQSDSELLEQDEAAADLREIRRDFERARKLPSDLVAELNRTSSLAIEAWKSARSGNDFEAFRPWMEKQVELNRRKAECYGPPPGGELYDALLEDFEPGLRWTTIERVFPPLRQELTRLIERLESAPGWPVPELAPISIPLERQRAFNRRVAEAVGFDFAAGRIDASVHPFSSGIGPGDTRITTRYREDRFEDALSTTLHEAGHGMYEQGLEKERYWGQPLGEAVGLAIHESQSRLWENHVGRSRSFWVWALKQAAETLGPDVGRYEVDDVYRAVNAVRPGLIRVESDEATYHLHVMLRVDLERAMLEGDLRVADLPAAWNERVARDLGLKVPDDAQGCLQDVHWAMGAIGYFATYTFGSLYAAQLWEAIRNELPDLDARIGRGEFAGLLRWLRENVHRHGRRFDGSELCQTLTGKPLGHGPLMDHLRTKLGPLYDVEDW